MITHTFEYMAPPTLEEALTALDEHEGNARLLAGGQSLIPLMKLGLSQPDVVIDLKRIPLLSYIRQTDNGFAIGALTRHVEIEESGELGESCPMLPAAARTIGHPMIRARGTIGGSLAHCDPRADYLLVLMALEAEVAATSRRGKRRIPVASLLRGPFESALEPNEIISEIRIPRKSPLPKEGFLKYEIGHGDFGLAAVAARIWCPEKRCEKARVWVSGLMDSPLRMQELEQELINIDDTGRVEDAVNRCVSPHESFSDFKASARFRKRVVGTLLKRAIVSAIVGETHS